MDAIRWRRFPLSPSAELLVAIAASSMALLTGVAVLLVARRASGALVTPLSVEGLLGAAVLLTLAAATIQHLGRLAQPRPSDSAGFRIMILLPLLPALAAAISLSVPATPAGTLAVFWCLLVAALSCSTLVVLRPAGGSHSSDSVAVESDVASGGSGEPSSPAVPFAEELPDSLEVGDLAVSQQLVRAVDAEGVDICRGRLHADFAGGQRTATLHVAFCPPFRQTPEIECEQADGAEVDVKQTQVLPSGMRLELRLAVASNQPKDAVIEFCATVAESSPAGGSVSPAG